MTKLTINMADGLTIELEGALKMEVHHRIMRPPVGLQELGFVLCSDFWESGQSGARFAIVGPCGGLSDQGVNAATILPQCSAGV